MTITTRLLDRVNSKHFKSLCTEMVSCVNTDGIATDDLVLKERCRDGCDGESCGRRTIYS